MENRYNILLGITGGIAAYKTPDMVRKLKQLTINDKKVDVKVIMTENAERLVAKKALETVSRNPVYTDTFEESYNINHIAMTDWADMVIIAPATANIIAKAATGIADDLLSTTVLAINCPLIIAPAMNANMWNKRVTQENISKLEENGVKIIYPESGELACGIQDVGRLAEIEAITSAVIDIACPYDKVLKGKKVLITAGATREYIDPVRYISNPSSGKMGYALAEIAEKLGAKVTLISGQTSLKTPNNVKLVSVISTEDMAKAAIKKAEKMDIIIGAAAPSDLTPVVRSDEKIKKQDDEEPIAFKKTTDILKVIGENKREGQIIAAFAAESDEENIIEYAKEKLLTKNADMIVANNITKAGAGFNSDTNEATIIFANGRTLELPCQSKKEMAKNILTEISKLTGF